MAKAEELMQRTISWAKKHNVDNMWTQASKTLEEFGETVGEMNHGRFGEAFEDGIGDTIISFVIYAHVCGKDVLECWEKALEEIESRTGKTVDGNFIKDEE